MTLNFQLYLLKQLTGIGNVGMLKLLTHFQTMDREFVTRVSVQELIKIAQIRPAYQEIFIQSHRSICENKDLFFEDFQHIKFVTILDEVYPEHLLNCYNPPVSLFYAGDITLLNSKNIGIVGARECTDYGKRVTKKIVAELVNEQYTIVSGLARGIDSTAHQSAIDHHGRTIGVIGCGLDVVYPKENLFLQEKMASEQLIISEYRNDTSPKRHHFPMRNRIIAGLSQALCVTEAKKKSGSLITATLALEEGREVFAVPGSIFSSNTEGCHELVQCGAKCVWKGQHIIEEIECMN